jgi:hypothetical protein
MDNPEAVNFVSNHVRPLAEMARDFIIRATPALEEWVVLESLFADDAEHIQDVRESEGVAPLTCAQVKAFIAILLSLNFAETEMTIAAPCVRQPLSLE